MATSFIKIMEQIDSRVLRERVLIFITLLASIFMLWNFLVQANFDREKKTLAAEAAKLGSEQQALVTQISSLTLAMATDPAIAKTNELRKLNTNIDEVETRLAGLSQGLIGAEQLPQVLEDILHRTTNVKLLQVRTLAVTEIQLASVKQRESKSSALTAAGTGVYKHGVLIRVAGSYPQLIQLVTEIEALEWKFYWESLDYTVTQYPNAEIDIRVFTLSSEEGLLGV
jgi:MSHA biogenesis protein MshJ